MVYESANVKKGFIIYVEKVCVETKTFPVTLDDDSSQQSITETAKKLDRNIKTGTIPPTESYHWNNQICLYCRYSEACENDSLVMDESEN